MFPFFCLEYYSKIFFPILYISLLPKLSRSYMHDFEPYVQQQLNIINSSFSCYVTVGYHVLFPCHIFQNKEECLRMTKVYHRRTGLIYLSMWFFSSTKNCTTHLTTLTSVQCVNGGVQLPLFLSTPLSYHCFSRKNITAALSLNYIHFSMAILVESKFQKLLRRNSLDSHRGT